ncbi:MAG: isoprenyl transferase [Bdellovibrionales bacterium]|nr:isoprenyl transferase [Bdellovibrionales bacterium]
MSSIQATDPKHIAIIMDGNGRWARSRGRERVFGHVKGARVAKKIVEHCARKKVQALTLYAFSEENWSRPMPEVNFLMRLLARYIVRERRSLVKNNIQFRCIGQIEKIPEDIRTEIEGTIKATAENDGMVLTFALSYGGRQEVLLAVKNLVQLAQQGKVCPEDVTEEFFSGMLQTSPLPDPDLMIRTSGEWRLSNFLPWQSVYSELYFSDVLWPDFSIDDLDAAIQSFRRRDRRFGGVKSSPFQPESLHSL